MKITVERDDGQVEVFQNVTDAYLAVRLLTPIQVKGSDHVSLAPDTSSKSWGDTPREIVKEVSQSLVELQDFLRSVPRGDRQ